MCITELATNTITADSKMGSHRLGRGTICSFSLCEILNGKFSQARLRPSRRLGQEKNRAISEPRSASHTQVHAQFLESVAQVRARLFRALTWDRLDRHQQM